MKNLSKEEMKKIVGGDTPPQIIDCCPAPKETAHCFWDHGACLNTAWGRCPAGDNTCMEYCAVRS